MKHGKDCIGVFVSAIMHDGAGNFLMGKRGGAARDQHGTWEFGGGTVDFGEDFESALRREMLEEFGVELFNLKQVDIKTYIHPNSHWIGIFYVAQINRGEEKIMEPIVYDELRWVTADTLPTPLMEGDLESLPGYLSHI